MEERVLSLGENRLTQGGYFMQPEGVEMFSLKMLAGDSRKRTKRYEVDYSFSVIGSQAFWK